MVLNGISNPFYEGNNPLKEFVFHWQQIRLESRIEFIILSCYRLYTFNHVYGYYVGNVTHEGSK